MTAFTNWISEWATTLRIAPPFSRRRRDLLAAIAEADRDRCDPDAWEEVGRPVPTVRGRRVTEEDVDW